MRGTSIVTATGFQMTGAKGRSQVDKKRDDILATSENISADARELDEIERRKRDLDVQDEELVELSHRAEALATEMAQKARVERRLVEAAEPSAS
jgi:hypothetical protein